MRRTPNREAKTPAMLLWREALSFVEAAQDIPTHRTASLHLAAHGIELALKSHLRAKGYSLAQLRKIGHSLLKALLHCSRNGMPLPSLSVRHSLRFLAEAHGANEWRYAHLDRPPHMDWEDLRPIAEWALLAGAPAVAQAHAKIPEQAPGLAKTLERDVMRAIGSPKAPARDARTPKRQRAP